jgi:hypothetical protein
MTRASGRSRASQAGAGGSPAAGVPARSAMAAGCNSKRTPNAQPSAARDRIVRFSLPERIWLILPAVTPSRSASSFLREVEGFEEARDGVRRLPY